MNVNEEFAKFWKAEDVASPVALTINSVKIELLGDERERNLVVGFDESHRMLVAKPVRRQQLIALFGPDTAAWMGQTVELFAIPVPFGREMVQSIQIRAPQAESAAKKPVTTKKKVAQAAQAPFDDLDDDIPDFS